MNEKNIKFAAELLLVDPENGEELFPESNPKKSNDGGVILMMRNKEGDRRWKHTIKTEEM